MSEVNNGSENVQSGFRKTGENPDLSVNDGSRYILNASAPDFLDNKEIISQNNLSVNVGRKSLQDFKLN